MDIKKAKKTKVRTVDPDDGQEEVQEVKEVDNGKKLKGQIMTTQGTETLPVAAPPPPPPKKEVAIEEDRSDWVTFTCMELIDPSPTVGSFSFSQHLGLTKLEAKKNYTMPYHVAIHLEDKKKGQIVQR
jgi:hypothetical protein